MLTRLTNRTAERMTAASLDRTSAGVPGWVLLRLRNLPGQTLFDVT